MFANGLLIVPTFPAINPRLDREALDRFSALMPDWKVVGLDCEEISKKGGSLHCMTRNLPPNFYTAPRMPQHSAGNPATNQTTLLS